MMPKIYSLCLSVFLLLAAMTAVAESSLGAESVGLRYAFDQGEKGNFDSYELFATSGAIWRAAEAGDTSFALRIEGSIGVLEGNDDSSVFVGLAPVLELSRAGFPVRLAFALGPTLFSEREVDALNLGGAVNFTSSVRMHWQITQRLGVRYQFQHTSNARIYHENDGINMHAVGLSYHF